MPPLISTPETLSRSQLTFTQAKPATILDRLGMASGLAFFVLFMYYGMVTPGAPEDFTNATLAAFYKQNVANHLVGPHIAAIAFLMFFIFAATLHQLVQQQVKSNNWLPTVLLGSGIMTTVIFIMGQASLSATALMASRDVHPDLVRGLDEISHITTHFFTAPLGLFLIATAFCILLYRILPRWIAVPNLLCGITLLVATGTFNHKELLHKVGVFALLIFLLTTLTMSIMLLWKSRKANKRL